MYKVSLISPVYNVEEYILICIDSILNQTMDNIEIIFVDDHGNDNSIGKAKEYLAKQNTRKTFRFAETVANSGPGIARNIGLQFAQGEYVAFIDSDDWLEPTYCEDLFLTAKDYDCDLSFCQAWMDFNDKKESVILKSPSIENGVFSQESKKNFLTQVIPYHWTFLFKREFLLNNQILYPKERSAEDSYFVIMTVLLAARVAEVKATLYHYIVRSGSISNKRDQARHQDKLRVFQQMLINTKDRGIYPHFKQELDFIYFKKGFLMSVFEYVLNSDSVDVQIVNGIFAELLKQIPDYKRNIYYRKKILFRLLTYLINQVPTLALILIKFSENRQKMV